jgi:hypothetical protein
MYDGYMKNTHLEHPEDSILCGKKATQDVINFLREVGSTLSVKYDGAPAIIFGTNPENGKFFVGTKSVFNKVKVKINYTHYDIEQNHSNNPKVAAILHVCLDNLPRINEIWQGDFIGFGGNDFYQPNTIEYLFDHVIDEAMVFVAHTKYVGNSMKELSAQFGAIFQHNDAQCSVKFLNPHATFASRSRRVGLLLSAASLISNFVKFPEKGEVAKLQIAINKCIRENREIDCIDGKLLLLFNLITQVKHLLMDGIHPFENVQCYIGNEKTDHEGFVMHNQFGTLKLVNRRVFSYNNFTAQKNW